MNDPKGTLNETLQTIHSRHSIRTFAEQDVPDDQLHILLQAANEAPSAHNQQPWRFVILRNRKKQELAQLVTSKAGEFPKPASALLRMAARSIVSAPVVIAVANTGELLPFRLRKPMPVVRLVKNSDIKFVRSAFSMAF